MVSVSETACGQSVCPLRVCPFSDRSCVQCLGLLISQQLTPYSLIFQADPIFSLSHSVFPVLYCYIPRNEVRGVYWNHHVCLPVRLLSAFGFPAHNCFPFTPIIMNLHMQTPHEARMCPIDFEVKRSKVKVTMHKLLKMVSGA